MQQIGKRIKLVAEGSELSEMTIDYIPSFTRKYDVAEPVLIREPLVCTL